jgi:hypothetical protein
MAPEMYLPVVFVMWVNILALLLALREWLMWARCFETMQGCWAKRHAF